MVLVLQVLLEYIISNDISHHNNSQNISYKGDNYYEF
nr:MAG TPA_asm: hypothetical protein [Bacteriophage sp.]